MALSGRLLFVLAIRFTLTVSAPDFLAQLVRDTIFSQMSHSPSLVTFRFFCLSLVVVQPSLSG